MYEKSVASDYRATPYLICRDASTAIDWYQRAFGVLSDVGRSFSQAVSAGAKELMGVSDQFDGERRVTVVEPYGHAWLLAQKLEEIPFAEMLDRFEKMMSGEA